MEVPADTSQDDVVKDHGTDPSRLGSPDVQQPTDVQPHNSDVGADAGAAQMTLHSSSKEPTVPQVQTLEPIPCVSSCTEPTQLIEHKPDPGRPTTPVRQPEPDRSITPEQQPEMTDAEIEQARKERQAAVKRARERKEQEALEANAPSPRARDAKFEMTSPQVAFEKALPNLLQSEQANQDVEASEHASEPGYQHLQVGEAWQPTSGKDLGAPVELEKDNPPPELQDLDGRVQQQGKVKGKNRKKVAVKG